MNDVVDEGELTFRPLTRDDFPTLGGWLGQPHVSRWWHHGVSADEVERDFGPVVGGNEPSHDMLVLLDGVPIGLMQLSALADYPEYRKEMEEVTSVPEGAVTIDYLIGEPALIGIGLGTRMIARFVEDLWRFRPEATCVIVPVHADNPSSWKAAIGAGFHIVGRGSLQPDNPDDSRDHLLLRIDRPVSD